MQWTQTRARHGSMLILFAAALLALAGCESGPFAKGTRTSDADIRLIRHAELVALREAEPGRTVLIDVRSHGYADRHIPGALHRPLPELRANDPSLIGDKLLVVHGQNRFDPLSAAAAKRLIELGYANVYDFRDGLDRWVEEGGEVTEGEGAEAH